MRIKLFLAIVSLINFRIAVCQENITNEKLNHKCWTTSDGIISFYVDSLNHWENVNPFPDFLLNPNFDMENRGVLGIMSQCLKDEREEVSFRKAIFDRIYYVDALSAIIKAKSKNLDKLYNREKSFKNAKRKFVRSVAKQSLTIDDFPEFPFMQSSTRQLAELRLKELNEAKRLNDLSYRGCWLESDRLINSFADSLNLWRNGLPLPGFLYNKMFDFENQKWTMNCLYKKELISYRKEILDRVVNEEGLIAISEVNDILFSERVDGTKLSGDQENLLTMPYMKYSTKSLAGWRLQTLRETKAGFSKR